MSDETVIEMRGVTKSFGRKEVLRGVDLIVPGGQTFAFLGRNGAGKTTTIRMLLGLLKPDRGEVRVLGLDPRVSAMEIRQRVGYVAEDQVMFGWMRVGQLLSFMAPFYPTWDRAWAKELSDRFELPLGTRVKHLSKGQGVRVALMLALAHRPRLVILDDPTLGLDPIMRKDFLRDLVTHLQGEKVSVFFSSHLLYEIEPVADSVVILDHGRVVRQAATEDLRSTVKRLVARVEVENVLRNLPGVLDFTRSGRQAAVVVMDIAKARMALAAAGVEAEEIDLNLDEIFEAYVMGERGKIVRKLIWKEWHEQSWKLGFGCVILCALAAIGLRARIVPDETMCMWVCTTGLLMLPVLSSSGLVAAERSEGSFELLIALPVEPWKILLAKTGMGVGLCALPLMAAMGVSLLMVSGREIAGMAIVELYGRTILGAVSLFMWMWALTVRLPNETRAALLAMGIMIFWLIATIGLAHPPMPAIAFATDPFSFVYEYHDDNSRTLVPMPMVFAAVVQFVIALMLWGWTSRRLGEPTEG